MTLLLVSATLLIAYIVWLKMTSSRRNAEFFSGKTIVITGGSQGLGRALAELLKVDARKIILWARDAGRLQETVAELSLKTCAAISCQTVDVTNYSQVDEMAGAMEVPDMVFCCAGASRPGWFLEQDLTQFYGGMQLNYYGALHTARAFAKRMVEARKKGYVVFISSTVGLMGMVGYSQYSPTKFALRGLAECLNQEFLPFGITFHVYFVASIKTKGFEVEELTKPEITKKLEGSDVSGNQSAQCRAAILIEGLKKNQTFITSDIFTQILLASSEGFNLRLKEIPWAVAGWLILPLVRLYFKNSILVSKTFKNK